MHSHLSCFTRSEFRLNFNLTGAGFGDDLEGMSEVEYFNDLYTKYLLYLGQYKSTNDAVAAYIIDHVDWTKEPALVRVASEDNLTHPDGTRPMMLICRHLPRVHHGLWLQMPRVAVPERYKECRSNVWLYIKKLFGSTSPAFATCTRGISPSRSRALALARPSLWSHPRSPTSRPTRLMCAHRTRESPPQSRAVPHSGRRVSRA